MLEIALTNKSYTGLLGTFSFPIRRGESLYGLSEGLESTELGMTFEVVPWCSTGGKDHRIILVPHSDVCEISGVRGRPKRAYAVRTVRLGDFRARERGSDLGQERVALGGRSIRPVLIQLESHLRRERWPPDTGPISQGYGKAEALNTHF